MPNDVRLPPSSSQVVPTESWLHGAHSPTRTAPILGAVTAQALNQALPSTWTVTISTPWNFWWRTAAAWCLNSRSES